MEIVTIGCRLPHGLVLEVGYDVVAKSSDGKSMTQLTRGPNYQRFVLKGTNQTAFVGEPGNLVRLPARSAPEPFINRNVPKVVWEQWLKDHPGSWHVKSGNVFEVKEPKQENIKAAVMDAMAKPVLFAPLDPTKSVKIGSDTVEIADFAKDRAA